MIARPVTGTWFEFFHHNKTEGHYFNPAFRSFTDEQWRAKLQEIASLNMRFLVLMCTSLAYEDHAESYFPGGPFPFPEDMVCQQPMEILFDECDRLHIRVFVSCGFYGNWTQSRANMSDPEVTGKAFQAMERLYALYGRHASFYGWYLPDEVGLSGNSIPEDFISYVNRYHDHARQIAPAMPLMISPYGVKKIVADDHYSADLSRLSCEIITYQDGVGVGASLPADNASCFRALKKAHDRAGGPALWANVETFSFEGSPYRSPLIPADITRLETQINGVSPYVEEILCYEYQGMMNPADSRAFCGHQNSVKLYDDYRLALTQIRE